ncbi:MAG: GNAT family N-acetyltransferase [Nitrosopumilus sp. (ex Thoosa mismalolli)]|nr:GNAT family N-acetyltransferase [Nitrosopumilus sp. (ex Thoosa mismalolli)]
MQNISIREASDVDIPILLGLLYELGRPEPEIDSDVDSFRKLVKQYISDSEKIILVAVLDEMEIVGMMSIVFMTRLNQKTLELYIPELVVREKYQHSGIGSKLINSCIEIGKKKNCHRLRLESGNQRISSHQFYKHLGFSQYAKTFTKKL